MSILQASKIHKAVHFGKNLQAFLLVVDTRLPMFDNTTDYVTPAVVGTIAGNYSGGEAAVEWRG